jgi:FkbM family methyltransferase
MSPEERYRPYPFAGGLIYLDVDESPMMRRRAEGTYEPRKVAAVQRLLPPGGTFVDVGANKGDFALIAARTAGPEGQVIAIEPSPDNCEWIRRSVELNGYANVELQEVALSDSEGEAPLYLGEKSGWHSLVAGEADQDSITVRTRTLDALLEELRCPPPDVLKVDVEGGELGVLRGASRTLAAGGEMWILLDVHPDRGVDPAAVAEELRSRGFALRRPEEPSEELTVVSPRTRELFACRG